MTARALIFLIAATFVAAFPSAGRAEYPEQPIKVIVAWPPGGVTDTVARVFADQISKAMKQSVTVDNRAGANAIIGTQAAAKAPADGYTLQVVTAESHAINPSVYKNLPYDVKRDFEPIAMMVRSSFVLAAKAGLPVNSVTELVAYAKANPGKLAGASYGLGSTSHLALASFEKEAGVSFLHVPYKGVSPAVNALAAGDVDIAFVTPHTVMQLAAAGQAKVLGSAALKRLEVAPNAPTFTEQGYKDFTGGNWYGVVAPKGTPAPVLKRLESELRTIVASDVMKEYARKTGVEVEFRDSKDFAAFIDTETKRLGEVVRDKKIELSQ